MRETVISEILKHKIIAIVRGLEQKQAVALADALYEGGVRLIEVTFDQRSQEHSATTEAISCIRERFGDKMHVGAGTVLSLQQLEQARQAGAEFIISPNVDRAVIEKTRELELVSLPGALTPTEIVTAYACGADMVKVFPAASMPVSYLKDISAPLPHIPLLAVGGVNAENMMQFLKAGAKGVGVGGSLVNKALIEKGDMAGITALARTFTDQLR